LSKFHSFMNELEIENLMNEGKFSEALPLLLDVLESKNYISKEILLNNISVCYLHLGDYDKARIYLEELIEINPENTTALYNLALSYFFLEEYGVAIKYYEKLKSTEGMNIDIVYNLGLCYLKVENFEEADYYFDYLVSQDVPSELIYNLGIQLITDKHPQKARKIFTSYLAKKPNDIDSTFGLGLSYTEMKEFRKAIECFSRVLEWDHSRFPSVRVMLGMAYFEVGEIKNAISNIQYVLRHNPDNPEAWYYMGVIYESTGQKDKAVVALKKAGELSTSTPEIWENLAYIFFNDNQLDDAMIYFKKAYQINGNPEFAFKIGLIYMMKDDYKNAIDYFTLSLEKNPENIMEIKENLGISYYHLGKYNETIGLLSGVVQNGKAKDVVYFIVGSSYMKLGLLNKAREYLEEGLKINPSNVNILYSLGILEANKENFDLANSHLEKAVIIERSPEIIYALALAKMKTGEIEVAVELFEEYKLFHQSDVEIMYKLGLLYIQLNQIDKAKKIFKEVLEIIPSNKKALEYLIELEKYENKSV